MTAFNTAIVKGARQTGRQEVLLELIEWVIENSDWRGDEMSYRAFLGILNHIEDMAGVPRTMEISL